MPAATDDDHSRWLRFVRHALPPLVPAAFDESIRQQCRSHPGRLRSTVRGEQHSGDRVAADEHSRARCRLRSLVRQSPNRIDRSESPTQRCRHDGEPSAGPTVRAGRHARELHQELVRRARNAAPGTQAGERIADHGAVRPGSRSRSGRDGRSSTTNFREMRRIATRSAIPEADTCIPEERAGVPYAMVADRCPLDAN